MKKCIYELYGREPNRFGRVIDFALLYHHCPLQSIRQNLDNHLSFHQHTTQSQKPSDAGEKGRIKVMDVIKITAPEQIKYLSIRDCQSIL
jgi:hypothetical protein